MGRGQVRPREKMISHKEPEDNEGCPVRVYGQLFRPMEQQVQRPWGWDVPSTQGTSKELGDGCWRWGRACCGGWLCAASKTCSGLVFCLRETEGYVTSCIMRTTVLEGLKTECRGRGQKPGNQWEGHCSNPGTRVGVALPRHARFLTGVSKYTQKIWAN